MKNLAFIGAGSHSDAVLPMIDTQLYRFAGYFDDKDLFERNGYPVLGKINEIDEFLEKKKIDVIFITIGENKKRKEVFDKLTEKWHSKFINIISKKATILTDNSIQGVGIFIGYNSFIGSQVSIKDNSIVNTGAIVEHHTTVGEHCNISPGATINGFCIIGNGSYIGSGSVLIQLKKIADWSIIGAGAVVVRDLMKSGVYVGVPAKKIKDVGE